MVNLHLLIQIIGVVTLATCAPTWTQDQQSANVEDFSQVNEDVQQIQGHDDYYDISQQQEQNEDLSQFQQQSGKLKEMDYNTEDHLGDNQQQTQNEDFSQYSEQNQQDYLNHDQQGQTQVGSQSARLEDFGQEDFQQSQNQEEVRDYDQQSQNEDLSQLQQQNDQIQQYDDLSLDSQQQTQNEDLSQFQHGQNQIESQIGRLENFDQQEDIIQNNQIEDFSQLQQKEVDENVSNEAESEDLLDHFQQQTQNQDLRQVEDFQQESEEQQQSQNEDFSQYQQQSGKILQHEPDTENFSQQQTQNEDLNQYQDGQMQIGSQSGRLESFDDADEKIQQTQREDLNQYDIETQQTQDKGELLDDVQQTQIDDFNQGQIQNGSPSGRLEQFGDEAEDQQSQIQQTQLEDMTQYEQQQGQEQTDDNADILDGTQQQSQVVDLIQFPQEEQLQISQIRHEQSPYGYNNPLQESRHQRPIENSQIDEDEGHSPITENGRPKPEGEIRNTHVEDSYPKQNQEEQEVLRATAKDLHSNFENFDLPGLTTARPGFWRRFGNRVQETYSKAKDKASELLDTVREKVG